MKLFFAALLALSLISCTKKSETVVPGNDAVSAGAPVEMAPPQDLPDPAADMPAATPAATPIKVLIAAKDRACNKTSDCQIVRTQCSCDCGEGVNKAQAKKYASQADELCKNYAGKMCKVMCNGQAKCVNKVCTYAQ